MAPSSFDISDTVVFPVVGGIIAGIIVVAIELGFRVILQCWQKRKAEKAMGEFFGGWEDKINDAKDLFHAPTGRNFTKSDMQFVHHREFLRQFPIRLNRWSKFLSEKQTEEITLHVIGHENAILIDLFPGKNLSQVIYDVFFSEAKKIKWLKF